MRHSLIGLALALSSACGGHAPSLGDAATPPDGGVALLNATLAGGGPVDVEFQEGRISAVVAAGSGGVPSSEAVTTVDLSGLWLAPAFIDSHVHLAYYAKAEEMAAGGVAAAVDLAAPLSWLIGLQQGGLPLKVLASGPMVTAEGGYPTRGWGAGGYGLECADAAAAADAVRALAEAGAALIKLPVTSPPVLDEDALVAAVEAAHGLGLKVASHALSDGEAATAARVGADLLAHTPTEALAAETVAAWSDRTVISTLRAFGGGSAAVSDLAALRAAGARVLYGTDFGNTRTTGIDGEEIALLEEAGLDGAAILAAGTSAPADFWGLTELGEIAVGKEASLLVLSADPLLQPETLASPAQVWIAGARLDGR